MRWRRPGISSRFCRPMGPFREVLNDRRISAMLIGPGAGVTDATCRRVLSALAAGKPLVLDADALTAFSANRRRLFAALTGSEILTPHEGEFERLFPSITEGGKLERARAAAKLTSAVVVLKGADTVITAPNGRAIVNANAPPELATGGTGDVLAGMMLGLRAQGVPAMEAAAMGAWLHGAAAAAVGPGLIAEDLPQALAPLIRQIRARRGN